MKTVSAADANRYFSRILRDVKAGETVVVTLRGEPVATIHPAIDEVGQRRAAKRVLLQRLQSQPAQNLPVTWTRDELYDD